MCSWAHIRKTVFFKQFGSVLIGHNVFQNLTALAAGIPLLNPYLKDDADFTHGVNFAVGGATALSAKALAEKDIMLDSTDNSLGVQLDWMSNHFASQCHSDGCMCSRIKYMMNSLHLVLCVLF